MFGVSLTVQLATRWLIYEEAEASIYRFACQLATRVSTEMYRAYRMRRHEQQQRLQQLQLQDAAP